MTDGSPKRPVVPEEVLRMESVTKRFGRNLVLDRVSLRLTAGEELAILGKSGSGKSVLLKIVTGLLEPDEGSVFLWGRCMDGLGDEGWLPSRRRLGMVFQAGALFDSLSVFENVAFPLRERKMKDENEIRSIVEERLEWVGLPGQGERPPSELSGGMRRRVALARTLAADPEFILYDEPTAGLDPVTGRKIAHLMRDLDRKLGSTSILVTHDIACARAVSRRWAYLSEGHIVADGSPEELLEGKFPELQEFLGEGP
jgi:phospholipid/cholesterol/gamma-HCH transport system ATP-binding protein